MNSLIRIPRLFYDDHVERDLPAPDVVKHNNRHYWIDANSEHLAELHADAFIYSDFQHWDFEVGSGLLGLCVSAAATDKAIKKYLDEEGTSE